MNFNKVHWLLFRVQQIFWKFTINKSVNRDSVIIKRRCSDESVAPQTPDTVSKLKSKHPDDNGEAFDEIMLQKLLLEMLFATQTFERFDIFHLWRIC